MESIIDTIAKFINVLSPLANVFAALIALYGVYHTHNANIRRPYYNDSFLKVISPIFNILENYLFRKKLASKEAEAIILKINNILNVPENLPYVDREILYTFRNFSTSKNGKDFIELCNRVNIEYDKCCIILGIDRRRDSYRIKRKQYRNKTMFILAKIRSALTAIYVGSLLIAAIVIIISFVLSVMPILKHYG